ncbi:MAG: nucleotidyl transferase AbiEii/AbiGii toxin family protein [Oligosphaeraceae bacterium]
MCWVLSRIFGDAELRRVLRFKGGTSLSKAFHLIERFSEDIDLILDWRLLTQDDPMKDRSNAQQDKLNKRIQEESAVFITSTLKRRIDTAFDGECDVVSDHQDGHIIWIEYPHDGSKSNYIAPRIKLEIGPLASWIPHRAFLIMPYVGEVFPQLGIQACDVPTILAERTFWEKVTILHQEHFRPKHLAVPSRFSRHYYDLFKMSSSEIGRKAIADVELLHKVVEFKQKFYPRAWARYDLAIPGKICLMPAEHIANPLAADYAQMREMIFGDYPSWTTILSELHHLEAVINDLKSLDHT